MHDESYILPFSQMPGRKILGLILLFIVLISGKSFGQDDPMYLYHEGLVATPKTFHEKKPRPWKTSIDAGLVFGFASVPAPYSNYVNGVSASTGYTFGLIEEIPVQKRCYVDIGIEILQDGVSFNSYYFAPGASFLYDGVEPYSHDISMNEIQVPVLFKFPLGPLDRKYRSIYMTVGGKFRYISYTNSTVTNDSNGYLKFEGEKDVTSLYKLFSPFGSSILEISMGYQRNTMKKIKRGWYMNLEYDYGISPLIYSGNRAGSNDVVFRLNTLIFKIGKIF
jgi:hypothetical protein